jgi:hypothetical protein
MAMVTAPAELGGNAKRSVSRVSEGAVQIFSGVLAPVIAAPDGSCRIVTR